MKAKCKATLFDPSSSATFVEGKEYDLPGGFVAKYKNYFVSAEKIAKTPENKMITAEKETVKTQTKAEPVKRGRKKSG